jgi:hypothetical protein
VQTLDATLVRKHRWVQTFCGVVSGGTSFVLTCDKNYYEMALQLRARSAGSDGLLSEVAMDGEIAGVCVMYLGRMRSASFSVLA